MSGDVSQHALVLAPHPDDETLGCGGTIKLISSQGGLVDVCFLTRGEAGLEPGATATLEVRQDLAQTRLEEARQACQVLGVRQIIVLDGQDTRLQVRSDLAGRIGQLLAADDYRSVFCPWPREAHDDHVATYKLLRAALSGHRRTLNVWLYEIWTPLEPNLLIPIDTTLEAKMAAIGAYRSQLAVMDYATAFRALAQYRSLLCPPARFAEAFFTCDSEALLDDSDPLWAVRQPSTKETGRRL